MRLCDYQLHWLIPPARLFIFVCFDVLKLLLNLQGSLYTSINLRHFTKTSTTALLIYPKNKKKSLIKPFYMKKFYLSHIIILYTSMWCGHSSFGWQLLNVLCNPVNKYFFELAEAIKILHTQINITYVLTTEQAKYRKGNRITHPCHFETVIFKKVFPFINFTFVTRKWENKSAPTELITRSKIFYFSTLS